MNYNDIFTYDDGVLRWKVRINQGVYIGDVAVNKAHNGYLQVGCKGKMRLVHRIVWEMHNGQIAKGMQVDHINHIRHDNRIENLRLVSSSENSKNLSLRSDNTSSTTGVSWDKKSKLWYAKICVDKKQMNLGRFASFESAVNARKAAEKKYMFHENHGNKNEQNYR